jgi:hypothetical protein
MAIVPVPNTALVEVKMLWRNQQVENTLWVQNRAGPFDVIRAGDLAAAVKNWFTATYLTLISNEVEALAVLVTDQEDPAGPIATATFAGDIGGAPTPSQANNVTLAITFRTGLRGRGFHGRNYIIGVPGTVIGGNDVSAGFRDDIQSAYQTLRTDLDAVEFDHVVAHRFEGSTIVGGKKVPTPLAVGVTTPILAYAFFDSTVDAQRRRLPGRGK